MRKIVAIASAVAVLGMSAGASAFASEDASPAEPRAKRSCFFANQVNGWSTDRDEKVAYLNVGVKEVYRAELFSRCADLDSAQTIGLESRRGGSNICHGLDATIIVPSPIGPQRCPVTKITRMTPEEVAAWKAEKKARK